MYLHRYVDGSEKFSSSINYKHFACFWEIIYLLFLKITLFNGPDRKAQELFLW
jgi:hypothetical protein